MAEGKSVEKVLVELCGAYEEVAHSNGAVASFALDADEGESDDEGHDCKAGGENAAPATAGTSQAGRKAEGGEAEGVVKQMEAVGLTSSSTAVVKAAAVQDGTQQGQGEAGSAS